jgi:hypothetical protein
MHKYIMLDLFPVYWWYTTCRFEPYNNVVVFLMWLELLG